MTITAEQVKELRQATGAGVLDCRKALEETGGDVEKAVVLLRKRGMAKAAQRADRETRNGVLDLYSHGGGRVGVMVEVNCETDFVARTEPFRELAHEIALQIAATSPKYIKDDEVPPEVIEKERAEARSRALEEGGPEHVIDRFVEDRLAEYFDEVCLMRQPYIRDESKTMGELVQELIATTGENITVRRFARWTIGESLDG